MSSKPAPASNKPAAVSIPKQSPASAAKVRAESHDRLDPKRK